jgi:predicted DsbA family dithiol-disulfide isomerase
MKKLCLAVILTAFTGIALAAPSGQARLEKYFSGVLTLCPSPEYQFEKIDGGGPAGFDAFVISVSSPTSSCRERTTAVYSEKSGQVLTGHFFQVGAHPQAPLPAAERIRQQLQRGIPQRIEVRVLGDDLPDGLRRVQITKESPTGPVVLHGYLDRSEEFLVIGRLGRVGESPEKEIYRALGVEHAASRGPEKAPIEILEVSDFQCPACRRAHEIIEPYLRKHGDRIRYMRLDLPITDFHDWTMQAALGGRAIQKIAPEHYWAYVDYIFQKQPEITKDSIDQYVRDFVEGKGLDWARLRPHYQSAAEQERLNRQTGRAFENNIVSTPTILINGRIVHYGDNGSGIEAHLEELFPAVTN